MMQLQVTVPDFVKRVLDALAAAGFHGYLVGGSLRDILLGRTPHDFDLTTDATPAEMLEVFSAFRTIPTGLRHGTVTVLSEGNPVEVTTHRLDGAYTDSRHPDAVCFTQRLTDDLARRDFTVNAMAWSEQTGLTDPFAGQADLAAGLLRAVGVPERRFREDALRVLRLFRFVSKLGFDIHPDTRAGAIACREGLANISAERIFGELCRTLCGTHAVKGLSALAECGCVPYVFGALTPDLACIPMLERLPQEPEVRLAALCRSAGAAACAALCKRLRTSNDFCDAVCGIISAAEEPLPANAYEARRFACGHYHHRDAALLLREALGEDVTEARALVTQVVRDRTAVDLPRLAVNGRELQEKAGVRAEKTAVLLRFLQDAVWREPAANKKARLLALAREWVEKEEGDHA